MLIGEGIRDACYRNYIADGLKVLIENVANSSPTGGKVLTSRYADLVYGHKEEEEENLTPEEKLDRIALSAGLTIIDSEE